MEGTEISRRCFGHEKIWASWSFEA